MSDDRKKDTPAKSTPTRRHMLMKLGLAATAAYAAPMLLTLSEARATSFSPPSRPSGPRRPGDPRPPRSRRRRQVGTSFTSFSR